MIRCFFMAFLRTRLDNVQITVLDKAKIWKKSNNMRKKSYKFQRTLDKVKI